MDCVNIEDSVRAYDVRVEAALRLFCHHDRRHHLARPFKDPSTRNCYASDGRMAIRYRDAGPIHMHNSMDDDELRNHVRNLERSYQLDFARRYVSASYICDAAEIALAIAHREHGYYDADVDDDEAVVFDNSELALVYIPGVGLYRADFLLATARAMLLLRCGWSWIVGVAQCCGQVPANIMRIDSQDDRVSVVICGFSDGVLDNDVVVVNSETFLCMTKDEIEKEMHK